VPFTSAPIFAKARYILNPHTAVAEVVVV